jgi:hypothetical protein
MFRWTYSDLTSFIRERQELRVRGDHSKTNSGNITPYFRQTPAQVPFAPRCPNQDLRLVGENSL